MLPTMNTRANAIRFATSFRWLAVVFSVVILLSSLFPSHAGTSFVAGDLNMASASTLQSGNEDQPNPPDGMAGHIVGHCSCSIVVLPQPMAHPVSLLARPIRFAMTASPFIPFGDLPPPSEPPRA